jgi:hypothetical protein
MVATVKAEVKASIKEETDRRKSVTNSGAAWHQQSSLSAATLAAALGH